MPTTVDELYDVLKAFKDEDANGNGDPTTRFRSPRRAAAALTCT
jgi:hypothetical protein